MGANCVSLDATSTKEMADRRTTNISTRGRGQSPSGPISRQYVDGQKSTIEKRGTTTPGKSKTKTSSMKPTHTSPVNGKTGAAGKAGSTHSTGKQTSSGYGKDQKVEAYNRQNSNSSSGHGDKDKMSTGGHVSVRDTKHPSGFGHDRDTDQRDLYNHKLDQYSHSPNKTGAVYGKEPPPFSRDTKKYVKDVHNKGDTHGLRGSDKTGREMYSNSDSHSKDADMTRRALHSGNTSDPYYGEETTSSKYNTRSVSDQYNSGSTFNRGNRGETGYSYGSSYGYSQGYSSNYYDDDRESSDSDDERYGYRTKYKKRGLTNLGNTCYMNSAIQALNICSGFRDAVLQENPSASDKTQHELWKLFKSMKKKKSSSKTPGSFYRVAKPAWFAHGQQQDSSVFLRNLLSNVDDEGGAISRLVQEKFRIRLNDVYKCKSCKKMAKVPDDLLDLMLPFPVETYTSKFSGYIRSQSRLSVQDMLQDFLNPEHPRDEEETECRFCYHMTRREVSAEITQLPEYLILTIPRFGETGHRKNTTPVEYPEWITVPVKSKHQDEWFALVAVIVHSGSSIMGGHYYSYGREDVDKNEWYQFNDSFVDGSQRQFEERQGGSATACAVIYRKHAQTSYKEMPSPAKAKGQDQPMDFDESSQDYYNQHHQNSSNQGTEHISGRSQIKSTGFEYNQGPDNQFANYAEDSEKSYDKKSSLDRQYVDGNTTYNQYSSAGDQGNGVAGCLNWSGHDNYNNY